MKNVFISYSRQDRTFAERLARDLQDAGLNVWIDFRRIKAGEQWREAIFEGINQSDMVIVCLSPAAVESDWVRREILMAFGNNKVMLPITVEDAFALMEDYDETKQLLELQITRFEGRYEEGLKELLAALTDKISTQNTTLDPADIPNPFKGLEAFQQTDAALFFGREDLTTKLLDKLAQGKRFLAVVGASGSGKSSLVRAGLIPKIRDGALPSSEKWRIVIFTPSYRPTEAMATRLMPIIGGERLVPEIVEILEKSTNSLHQLVEGILGGEDEDERVVLVIDQFEEVFTRASAIEANRFLKLIQTAIALDGGRTIVVLTLRADFFDRLSAYPELAALFEGENMVIVAEMTADNLRKTIEGPATAVGLVYEQGLPDRILEDVRQQPGSLPLLQYALGALFERRQGRQLTFAAYKTIGGVQRALADHADSIFDQLSSAQQDLMRRVLLQLVEVSDTGKATRRKVDQTAIAFREVSETAIREIIDMMAAPDSRLVIVSRDIGAAHDNDPEIEPTTWLEISHEALLREWGRLKKWIAEEEETLRFGGEFLKVATDWQRAISSQQPDFLLRGARLDRATKWLENADANALQREFIEISRRVETEQQEHTRERERHLMQGRFGLVLAIALVALLGLLMSWSQTLSERDSVSTFESLANERATSQFVAEQNLEDAQRINSMFYAELSRQELENESAQTALLLALESMKHYPDVWTVEGRDSLVNALAFVIGDETNFDRERYENDIELLLQEAQSQITRDFTPEERRQFFLPPLESATPIP